MGAPIGNTNGKDAGRPSQADEVKDLFEEEVHVPTLKKKIARGKGTYSIKDATMMNALAGKEKVQIAILNKRYAEKVQHSGGINFNADGYIDQSS
jgi:hypothetical protein